ncbi:MAG: hypothetical protein QG646_565 [Euryarchaeota archaeon]|nr:hypothetical protein [Euryarchaeota archaeon]
MRIDLVQKIDGYGNEYVEKKLQKYDNDEC